MTTLSRKTHHHSVSKQRKVSVPEIIRFAKANNGGQLETLKQRRPFTISWDGEQVIFYPESRTPFYPDLESYVSTYNQSRSLKPSDYPKDLWCNSYFVSMVTTILQGSSARATDTVAADVVDLALSPETERSEMIKCRLGQGKFRESLLELQGECYVTGVNNPRLLRASHIKPWRDSTNAERMDPHNGLLLTPLYDHLFDGLFISFQDDGRILISSKLTLDIAETLHIDTRFRGRVLSPKTRGYLAQHREAFTA
ncbi:MAG: HNH endonuclease signature motif containing protein [Verrucomicrobiota bacterium]